MAIINEYTDRETPTALADSALNFAVNDDGTDSEDYDTFVDTVTGTTVVRILTGRDSSGLLMGRLIGTVPTAVVASDTTALAALQQSQTNLASQQATISQGLSDLVQEVSDLGNPTNREGSTYILQVSDKHTPVIVNATVSIPPFTVGDAPATINVFNSSTDRVTVSGSNYTGITEIEGKGVATFFVTTDGTSVTTEGVGGRS